MRSAKLGWWLGAACASALGVALLLLVGTAGSPWALAEEEEERESCERHAWLGVTLEAAREEGGARVRSVLEGSPAERAGLRAGERIVAVDGRAIDGVRELVRTIRRQDPGASVELSVRGEDGVERRVVVTLGEGEDCSKIGIWRFHLDPDELAETLEHLPEELNHWIEQWGQGGEPTGYLGVDVLPASDALRKALGGPQGAGVLVNDLTAGSAAEKAGLAAGDLIVRIDGEEITSPSKLRRVVRAHDPGDVVSIERVRDGRSATVEATLGETTRGPRSFHFELPDGSLDFDLDLDFEKLHEQLRDELEGAREQLEGAREQVERLRGQVQSELKQARRELERAREAHGRAVRERERLREAVSRAAPSGEV